MLRRGGIRVRGRGGSPGGGLKWIPTNLGASLKLWFRADLGVTLNGSTVSGWANQGSASGENMVQPTAANQPTFIASGGTGIAGRADVSYGGSHYLYGSTTDQVTTALTAAIVFKTSTLSVNAEQPFGKGFAGVQWLFSGKSGGKLGFGLSGVAAISNAALNDNAPHYAVAVWDQSISSGLLTLYVDGVAQTATATTAGTISGTDSNGTGAEISGTPSSSAAFFAGQSPEAMLISRAINAGELASLNAYLKTNAGL